MNPGGIAEEAGQTARSIVGVMKESPLSLALVVMNFALVVFLFYSNQQTLNQRQSALQQIVDWQQRTDQLMASCVSHEVTKMMLDNMQRITETMLTSEKQEILRMQEVINQERERNNRLMERLLPGPMPAPTPQKEQHILFQIPP